MQNIFVEFLPPWIETGLQPAFYDKESGTVLQQVARMYAKVNYLIKIFNDFSKDTTDFVNDFVDSTNTEINRFETEVDTRVTNFEQSTTETVNDYIARFVALKDFVDDYFDNLDVQEEINNKLDDMLEQGTLQEIITSYIQSNVAWTFNTVADMKAATNLIDGSFAQTLGYYAVNDGGGGLYKITATGTPNEMDIIAIGSTLRANLITGDTVNILQLGAKADDENFDNQPYLQRAFDLRKTTVIGINETDIFWTYSAARFYDNIIFNSWLKNKGSQGQLTDRIIYIENVWSDKTITVTNPLINGNRDVTKSYNAEDNDEFGHGIDIRSVQNITIDGGNIINCYGDAIYIGNSTEPSAVYQYSKNVTIKNVLIDYPYRNGISIVSGVDTLIQNCTVYNRNGYRTILNEPNQIDTLQNENLTIDGGYYYGSSGSSIIEFACSRDIKNVNIKNCYLYNADGCTCSLRVTGTYHLSNINVEGITIDNHKNNSQVLLTTTGDINFVNNKIIGDQHVSLVQFKSTTGDIHFVNNSVYLVDGTTLKRIRIDLYSYTGGTYFNDNILRAANPTSGYSAQVNIREANIIFIERNTSYLTSNAFGVGDPRSNPGSPTHQFTTLCCYMIDNYVKADPSYTTGSRGLIIYDSTDITSLFVNYNFYDGITNKCSIWGDVTNRIGDVFA